jgi:hypothetical protein
MPTFIDESGDTGNPRNGGTPYFHVAAVWVPSIDNIELFQEVDRNEDASYLRIIKQQFRGLRSRHRPGSSMIGKVCFRDSSSHEMIQLADMICGAVGLKVERGEATWYECVAERDFQRFRFLE